MYHDLGTVPLEQTLEERARKVFEDHPKLRQLLGYDPRFIYRYKRPKSQLLDEPEDGTTQRRGHS